jgi:hypothetical protein
MAIFACKLSGKNYDLGQRADKLLDELNDWKERARAAELRERSQVDTIIKIKPYDTQDYRVADND